MKSHVHSINKPLSGWGNFRPSLCSVARPRNTDALRYLLENRHCESYIARGLGRSYGDSAVNHERGVIDQTAFNHFLDFDERLGVMHCEAGVSLAEIIQVALPRGWFLQTTPGTKFVTVGGAIAADVHGKNHHRDGSFGNSVIDFQLMTARAEVIPCSRSQNSRVFWATVGGMGLTGVILSARIQLRKVPTAYCRVDYRMTSSLDESLECFDATDSCYRYSVAWVDCLASRKSLGRGIVMLGNDAEVDELPARYGEAPLRLPNAARRTVPWNLPAWALNSLTVKAFNSCFYARHADGQGIVDYNKYFYPLDHIQRWNRLYGKRGFIQYQAFFPAASSRQGLVKLLETVAKSRRASFLAVLKSSGAANPGLLSFLRPGHTLALDIPNYRGVEALVSEFNRVLLKYGGRLYLAKDALATADVFHEMYDSLNEFGEIKREIDPSNRFSSSQARRLGMLK